MESLLGSRSSFNGRPTAMGFSIPSTIYLTTTVAASLFMFLMISSSTYSVESASVIHHAKRSAVITPQSNNDVYEECSYGSPCGWEVYDPRTRNLEYYVQSSCKCKAKETCVQIDDDVMISAYVYKCRVVPRRSRPRQSSSSVSPASTGRSDAESSSS